MELRELLSHLGRRLWLLVIIPLAALLLVLGLNAPSGTKYTSAVDLRATNPIGDPTVASINLFAGSLVNATTSDAVVNKVAQQAGVSAGKIQGGLSASRIADTELVHVTFSDTNQDLVKKVMEVLPAAAQEQAFAPALRQAETAQTEAKKVLDSAMASLDAIQKQTKMTDPSREYQAASSEVTSLRVALATAKGRPDTVTTKPIEDALKVAENRVNEVALAAQQFVAPQYAVDNARSELANRTSAVGDINAREASTVAESIGSDVTPLSWRTEVLRRAVSAVLIGLALAILLLAIPEVLRRSRRGHDDELLEHEDDGHWDEDDDDASTVRRSEVGV